MTKIVAIEGSREVELVTVRTVTTIKTVTTQVTVIEVLDRDGRVVSVVPGGEHTHTHTQTNTHLHHKD